MDAKLGNISFKDQINKICFLTVWLGDSSEWAGEPAGNLMLLSTNPAFLIVGHICHGY